MHNVEWTIEGTTLFIKVDVSNDTVKRAPPSSSGKTALVASTSGSVPVSGGGSPMSFSLNVMTKR